MVVLAAALAVSLFLVLNAHRVFVPSWRRVQLSGIGAEQGVAFTAPLPGAPEPTDRRSSIRLFEDGKPIGPGDSLHDDIRTKGGGRYSVWGGKVYFSSSDGTDPRRSGRRYEAEIPRTASPVLAWALLLLTGTAALAAAFRVRLRRLLRLCLTHAPLLGAGLVVAGFVLPRLAFWVDFPLPESAIDYWSYRNVVDQAQQGVWPKLVFRTPGYPLFIAAVLAISERAMSLAIAQCATNLICALVALWCFVRADRRLALPVGFGLAAFVSSSHSIYFDTTLMSESLYCSLLILSTARWDCSFSAEVPAVPPVRPSPWVVSCLPARRASS